MEEFIKKISCDNEHYEIDPEDKPIICTSTGKRMTKAMIDALDPERRATLDDAVKNFNGQTDPLDIIVVNSYYYESKRYGDYKIIRRISKLDGMRVVD